MLRLEEQAKLRREEQGDDGLVHSGRAGGFRLRDFSYYGFRHNTASSSYLTSQTANLTVHSGNTAVCLSRRDRVEFIRLWRQLRPPAGALRGEFEERREGGRAGESLRRADEYQLALGAREGDVEPAKVE